MKEKPKALTLTSNTGGMFTMKTEVIGQVTLDAGVNRIWFDSVSNPDLKDGLVELPNFSGYITLEQKLTRP